MVFEKNLEALTKRSKALGEYLVENRDREIDSYIIEQAKNGEPVLVCVQDNQKVFLNSKYNPSNEIQKYVEDLIHIPDKAVFFCFGISNGGIIKEFLEYNSGRESRIIIFEPSIDIFFSVMRKIDLSEYMMNPQVNIYVRGINDRGIESEFERVVQVYNYKNNIIKAMPKYEKIFPEEYTDFLMYISNQNRRVISEVMTDNELGKIACKNGIMNYSMLEGVRSGKDYVGIFPEDMPVIIVSAGPSLSKNINELKAAKGKALIAVVDTAIRPVINEGIKPDIIVSVDYRKNLNKFSDMDLSDVFFLADHDTRFEVLDLVKSKNLIISSSDTLALAEAFREEGSDLYSVDVGGSVATATIAYMISWGFKKIILCGQDLAMTNNQVHVGEESFDVSKTNFSKILVDGINGDKVITRNDYYLYIQWIERIAYEYKDVLFIDATEGGALKKNTIVMTLKDAINEHANVEYDIQKILSNPRRLFEGERFSIVTNKLKQMRNNIKNIGKQFKDGASQARLGATMLRNGDFNSRKLKDINAYISKLDNAYYNMSERLYLDKYVADAVNNFAQDIFSNEEDDIAESIRMFDKSAEYYSEVSEAAPKVCELIDNTLEIIKNKQEC